jgi:hypothetical protein
MKCENCGGTIRLVGKISRASQPTEMFYKCDKCGWELSSSKGWTHKPVASYVKRKGRV